MLDTVSLTRLSLGMVSTVMLARAGTSASLSSSSANSTSIPSSSADLMVNWLRLWSQSWVSCCCSAGLADRCCRHRLV